VPGILVGVVMVDAAVAGVEQKLQQGVRMRLIATRLHLHRQQEEERERQDPRQGHDTAAIAAAPWRDALLSWGATRHAITGHGNRRAGPGSYHCRARPLRGWRFGFIMTAA
jgi:hypothetical protein